MARRLNFMFWNDKLIVYRFYSTFPGDNSNFDEALVARLAKNKTTAAEAVQLLGTPSGMSIYPGTRAKNVRYLTYNYVEFNHLNATYLHKRLGLVLDPGDVVVDHFLRSETKPYTPRRPAVIPIPIFIR